MSIYVKHSKEYDTGIHIEIAHIVFGRNCIGDFFKGDRFPNLVKLDCSHARLTKLDLTCHALQVLRCNNNLLTELELDCPFLQELACHDNKLTKLELNCPSLRILACFNNPLTDLNGVEFCTELKTLYCSENLKESAEILKIHLPGLKIVLR